MQAAAPSLHRLAALLGGRAPAPAPLRALTALRSQPAPQKCCWDRPASSAVPQQPAAAPPPPPALPRRQRHRPLLPRLAASYSVVSDGGEQQGIGGGDGKPWRIIIYSKEGCHLCDGLKEKVRLWRPGEGRGEGAVMEQRMGRRRGASKKGWRKGGAGAVQHEMELQPCSMPGSSAGGLGTAAGSSWAAS